MAEETGKPNADTGETRGRQRRLRDGTVVSAPAKAVPRRPRFRLFRITDPARFGCSMLVFLITAIMILLHIFGK